MITRFLITLFLVAAFSPVGQAAEDEGPIGYTGDRIQLTPIMAPYKTSTGLGYEVLTIRLRLPTSDSDQGDPRTGCWLIPIVHEKILMYLYDANLKQADFRGQRREVLAENLFKAVIRATDRGLYTGLTLVDGNSEPITPATDPRSATLTNQCK